MSNEFTGVGNVGQAPVLRTVTVRGDNRSVAELRIYFDRQIPQGDGEFKEEGGFWLTVTVWGHRAESIIKLISKGMRVQVTGQLRMDQWEDDDGEARETLRLTADRLSIDLICLDGVQVRKKNSTTQPSSTGLVPPERFNDNSEPAYAKDPATDFYPEYDQAS